MKHKVIVVVVVVVVVLLFISNAYLYSHTCVAWAKLVFMCRFGGAGSSWISY